MTQIYNVFLVLFTIFHFDIEKFIVLRKNCKYIFFQPEICTFAHKYFHVL